MWLCHYNKIYDFVAVWLIISLSLRKSIWYQCPIANTCLGTVSNSLWNMELFTLIFQQNILTPLKAFHYAFVEVWIINCLSAQFSNSFNGVSRQVTNYSARCFFISHSIVAVMNYMDAVIYQIIYLAANNIVNSSFEIHVYHIYSCELHNMMIFISSAEINDTMIEQSDQQLWIYA